MGEHRGEDLQGRAKEAAGAVTGDDRLKREGKRDQAGAKAKDKVSETVDKVKDAFDKR